jgi:cobalamin-dependent methionine synthase I
MIKIASTLFIVIYVLTIAFMKQQTTNAIAKTKTEERLVCENTIAEANTKSTQTTIKTIKRYETIKSNLSKTDLNQRTRLLQQLEDFNFAD